MAITPNYSWPLPDDTSLVKDGAEAIRDLGNAIDNTVENLPSGGLVHIETADLATKSAQSFNNVFTSTFRNYKVIYEAIHSGSTDTRLRYRASGSDNSTANYTQQGLAGSSSSTTAFRLASQTVGNLSGTTGLSRAEIILINPNLSLQTGYIAQVFSGDADIRIVASNFGLTNIFDGFTLLINTGTFTSGQISVYGIKD